MQRKMHERRGAVRVRVGGAVRCGALHCAKSSCPLRECNATCTLHLVVHNHRHDHYVYSF